MRSLHIAALAFPTAQGTQAALHGMLSALACARSRDASALLPARITMGIRERELEPIRSIVSTRLSGSAPRARGRACEKGLLDVALAASVARCCAELSPDLVVAHHVEAALCTLMLPQAGALHGAHESAHGVALLLSERARQRLRAHGRRPRSLPVPTASRVLWRSRRCSPTCSRATAEPSWTRLVFPGSSRHPITAPERSAGTRSTRPDRRATGACSTRATWTPIRDSTRSSTP